MYCLPFRLPAVALAAIPAFAQLASWTEPVRKTAYPPVVFVTGHDAVCPNTATAEIPFFNLTFGDFDKVMAGSGRVSLVFEACFAPNRPPIEEIANVFGTYLDKLRYDTGERVPLVDVVAHSMGGLIVRSYLAGKQTNGEYRPPANPRIRKLVFIGTPHFGTDVAFPSDPDPQLREMSLGSPFLFSLATWNQGRDDLRGVDALSIVGTAGVNGLAGLTDSVVSITSASLKFLMADRTALFPLCHTAGGIGQLFLCGGADGLARATSENDPTAKLVLAFLSDSEAWRATTSQSAATLAQSGYGGLLLMRKSADDQPVVIEAASVVLDNGVTLPLSVSPSGLAYAEQIPAGPVYVNADGVAVRTVIPAGGSSAIVVKPGPYISAVEPASGPAWPLSLAPGMLVVIKGTQIDSFDTQVQVDGVPVESSRGSDGNLRVVLPANISGETDVSVQNAAGRSTVRANVEPTFPVLFMRDGFAAAARAANIWTLYLEGLGETVARDGLAYAKEQPIVTIDGQSCTVLYAGRAPELPGLDQINCRLPEAHESSMRVSVSSGGRMVTALLPPG